ncbi:V-type ATP synthase subunit I [Halobacteria archaeon HArc-gm2]|nr:V-type ATP synthase subunit I [Halobacteria archaeon HArc-gm2]
MLRPERMSRVSVTGSKRVVDDVVETVHGLDLLHLSEYDGSWEGFEPGDPAEGANEASELLVTVRSLESILDVEDEDAGPTQLVERDALESEVASIQADVNELDDRRSELRDELRTVEDRIGSFEPFVDLGIDLDLLSGYDSLEVAVGEGDAELIESELAGSNAVDAYEVFAEDGAVAVFVYPANEDVTVADLLVGVPFQAYDVPEAEGNPEAKLAELRERKAELESELDGVDRDLEGIKDDVAGFLLAAEETLTIAVQKREAPLSFATTDNAFVAEGWVPTDRYDELVSALEAAVGDHVEVEELEQAEYDRVSHHEGHEAVAEEAGPGKTVDGHGSTVRLEDEGETDEAAAAEEETSQEKETVADGGVVTMGDDDPPVVQDNPKATKPFELLTNAVGNPKYSEFDPTIILFLTFPLMFGFMIGDVGYGAIYTGIGYYMYKSFDGDAMKNFGLITAAAGISTLVFGVLYGEIFGLHTISTLLWDPLIGGAPIKKGLMPANAYWAEAWFLITALFGVVHMGLGYVFEFAENYSLHGFKEAMLETGSWLFALVGLWLFIFSRLGANSKPEFLYTAFASGEKAAFKLGFTGLPEWVGLLGAAMLLVAILMILVGPTHELVEIHVVLAHALSYLRISAVLLAKAGMAFAVNLLFFGAYEHHGEFHFMLSYGPEYVAEHYPEAEVMFGGMMHGGIALTVAGIAVLIVGHLVVLVLGVTSSGIQAIRLEYFEFFSKFYDGGGTAYSPFGHEREYTAEE